MGVMIIKMNLTQITNTTCIHKIRAIKTAVATEKEMRCYNCPMIDTSKCPCPDYKPVIQFNGERFAYLRMWGR